MRARTLVGLAIVGAGLAAGACVLDIPDVVTDGGADVVGDSPSDVAADGGPGFDAGPACDACGAPAGFTPVLFALDRATPCPSGTTDTELVADPSDGGAGACACGCDVTTQPSCFPSDLRTAFSLNASTCGMSGVTLKFADAGCEVLSATTGGTRIEIDPFVPDSGTCADVPASDVSKVATVASRMCNAATCASATCAAAPGFQACYAAAGDVACPTGLTKHAVGAAVALACACSGCSLAIDGGCEGNVTLFKNPDCTNVVETVPVDGVCNPSTAPQGTSFQSLSYVPSLVGVGCNAGTPSATVGLTQAGTICCP